MAWSLTIIPDQAQYRPGATARLELRVAGPPQAAAAVRLRIAEQERTLEQAELPVQTDAAGQATLSFSWPLPAGEGWAAWGVDARLADAQGGDLAAASSALDRAAHWRQAPRYGFLSDFAPAAGAAAADAERLELMRRLHLSCVQFYDWMYTHHTYLPPEETFRDPLGREVDFARVRARVAACAAQGMAPIAYASVYGGEEPFASAHPDWQLYDGGGKPMSLAGLFFIQDPSPASGWRAHLMGEYAAALGIGFYGLHCDTYGSPKAGIARRDGEETIVDLRQVLPGLVAEADAMARAAHDLGGAIFNCVGGWPIDTMAQAPAAALYIEVWPPNTSYRDLYETVMRARRLDPGRQIVLAAYLPPFHHERERPAGAMAGLRLAAATIFASGGFHLLPGEGMGLLADPYYPLFGRIDAGDFAVVQAYWDFQTRYGPILADPDAHDVTTTLCGGINRELRVEGAPTSSAAEPGAVWAICKQGAGYLALHLINLTAVGDPRWTEPQPEPQPTGPLTVCAEVLRAPESVWWASPDVAGGAPQPLDIQLIYEENVGMTMVAALPPLYTWTMLVIRSA